MKEENRNCNKHGLTLHRLYLSNGRERWRCLKCQTEATQKRIDKVKYIAVAYKGNKCQCCGYDKYIGALEFHHVDPSQKDFSIASKGYTHSWDKVRQEIEKCVLVCANCHREIHAGIRSCPEELINDSDAAEKAKLDFEENS